MADKSIEEQITETRTALFAALRNPNASYIEKRDLQEKLGLLTSRQIVQRQMQNEPAPRLVRA